MTIVKILTFLETNSVVSVISVVIFLVIKATPAADLLL
jgi:hypothetical protein